MDPMLLDFGEPTEVVQATPSVFMLEEISGSIHLSQQIEKLQLELNLAKSQVVECERLTNENKRLSSELSDLKNSSETTITLLQTKLKESERNEIEHRKADAERLSQVTETAEEVMQQLGEAKMNNMNLQNMLAERNARLKQLEAARGNLDGTIESKKGDEHINKQRPSLSCLSLRSQNGGHANFGDDCDELYKDEQIRALETKVQELTSQLTHNKESLKIIELKQTQDQEHFSNVIQNAKKQATTHEAKIQELTQLLDRTTKENNDKRQKAKALVMALTQDKQTLTTGKAELQQLAAKLHEEISQRDLQLQQQRDDHNRVISASNNATQKLNDEIANLNEKISQMKEAARNQEQAKELAMAKREVEEASKRRLAAKAETQKLAMQLEAATKKHDTLKETILRTNVSNSRKIDLTLELVQEAIDLLTKHAGDPPCETAVQLSSNKIPKPSVVFPSVMKGTINSTNSEDVRGGERPVSSPTMSRDKLTSMTSDESIANATDKLDAFLNTTSKLCELAMEQLDVTLTHVVLIRLQSAFSACFQFAKRMSRQTQGSTDKQSLLPATTLVSDAGNIK